MTRNPKFELKIEHLALAADLNFKPRGTWWEDDPKSLEFIPEIDPKRPFGNTGAHYDVAQRLNLLKEDEHGDTPMTPEIERLAIRYIVELPVALDIILRERTFNIGVYDVTANGAYFHYRNYMTVWFWLDAIMACVDLKDTQGQSLFDRAYTFTSGAGWNPYTILEYLRNWSGSGDTFERIYQVYRDIACQKYLKNHPDAANWDPESIVAVLIHDGDPDDKDWPFWDERLDPITTSGV